MFLVITFLARVGQSTSPAPMSGKPDSVKLSTPADIVVGTKQTGNDGSMFEIADI